MRSADDCGVGLNECDNLRSGFTARLGAADRFIVELFI